MKQHEDLFGIEVTGGGGSAAPDSGRPTERQSTRRSTSDEAHRSADVAATRKVMLDLISQRPRTCDEIVALGFAHQSASAAINWLMRQGHIVPSGEKRRTRMGRRAIVWRHEENPQPLVRTRPTRRELERELAQRDAERDALAAEVAALKAHDSLAEMWAALAEYQPQADANGHGESWRKMCEERTEEAAAAAYRSPQTLSRIAHAAYNAWWASQRDAAARSTSKEAVVWATNAVAAIRRAKEAKR